MIPEIGHFALIVALVLAVLLALAPFYGVMTNNRQWMLTGRSLAVGQFVFISISFACLAIAFQQDDFSVSIVANYSNSQLPDIYKFSAIWGGHEGSLLLWIYILSGWTVAVAMLSRQLPLDMLARILSVMGMVSIGFLLFSLLTSSAFERLLPNSPMEGKDLNPLLQDPGLVIHPPMLYFGYVGFSVAFAFAIAALWSGKLDATWARWSRPWTNVAWAFLTLGIALGSWWAYYELGWGGWWFWDPVENASFMPWLAGTALVHSLAVTEKRGMFKNWTLLLAIFTFSLSLLGTFLVRSGVLTSVHSFASDPTRGMFVLVFLAIVGGGSFTLYALRAPTMVTVTRNQYGLVSREMLLLFNNVMLLVVALTVLCGTLFPMFVDALGGGKYSVGPPYFNAVFVPLMAILFVFLGIGPSAHWKKSKGSYLIRQLLPAAIASIIVGLIFPYVYQGEFNISVAIAVIIASWLVLSTLANIRDKLRNAKSVRHGLRRLTLNYYGMVIAHIGVAFVVIGVCLTSHYSEERDVRLAVGDKVTLSGYEFTFQGIKPFRGPNFIADEATVVIHQNGKLIATLHPQKRRYLAGRGQMMTEAAIDPGLWRDLYVAMGERLGDDAWAVRVHYKPFIRFMWLGAIIMALGGLVAVADKRYRLARVEQKNRVDRKAAMSGEGVRVS